MSHRKAYTAGGLVLGLTLAAATTAWAFDGPPPSPAPADPAASAAPTAASTAAVPQGPDLARAPGASAESEATLAGLDGRGDPAIAVTGNNNNVTSNTTSNSTSTTYSSLTNQDLTAVNSGNSITANAVGSGAITLDGAALSGFAGIGNILMNTGHNNNMQSTMSVTVIIGP